MNIVIVKFKVFYLAILGIIITESSCNRSTKSYIPEKFISFYSGNDSVNVDSDGFNVVFDFSSLNLPKTRFIVNILDLNKKKQILRMVKPNIIIKSNKNYIIGKPIAFNSSNPPFDIDFFFLLNDSLKTEILFLNNTEILCFIRNDSLNFREFFKDIVKK